VTFRVRRDAPKPLIKAAIEGLFNVKVTGVNTIKVWGQDQALQGFPWASARTIKKLVVTLAEGQSIDVTTGI